MHTVSVERALAEAQDIQERGIIGVYPLSVVALAAEVFVLRKDSARLAFLYDGTKTGSNALVNAELKLLNGQTLTLEEVRAAIDEAMATPLAPPELASA